MAGSVELGRAAFDRHDWRDAYEQLAAADGTTPLEGPDVERLTAAAYLLGRDDDSAELWERAHHQALRRGETARAVRCAFWLAVGLLFRGEAARGGGWAARARRLLDDGEIDCVERGYVRELGNFTESEAVTARATSVHAGMRPAIPWRTRWRSTAHRDNGPTHAPTTLYMAGRTSSEVIQSIAK